MANRACTGDGGFTIMMGEFVTLIQSGLPVKVIVLNSGTPGFVEIEMRANGFVDVGCDLENPNFAAMAVAMGIKAIRVEQPQNLKGALAETLAHEGVSGRLELTMPQVTHPRRGTPFWRLPDASRAGWALQGAHPTRKGELMR